MKQQKLNNGFVNLIAEEGFYLAECGKPLVECGGNSQKLIKEDRVQEALKNLIEVPKLAVKEAKAEAERERKYKERVVELIRQKYSADDEAAIIRKYLALQSQPQPFNDAKMDEIVMEFDAYNAFAEECKERAKEENQKPVEES